MSTDLSSTEMVRFVAAVEAIYESAVAPEKWPAALDAIAAVFDDIGANLTFQRDDGTFGVIASAALQDGIEEYVKNWAHRDLRASRIAETNCLAAPATINSTADRAGISSPGVPATIRLTVE